MKLLPDYNIYYLSCINLLSGPVLIIDAVWAVTSSSISKPLECLHACFLRGVSSYDLFLKLTDNITHCSTGV